MGALVRVVKIYIFLILTIDIVIFKTHTLSFTLKIFKKHVVKNHIPYFSKFIEPYDP